MPLVLLVVVAALILFNPEFIGFMAVCFVVIFIVLIIQAIRSSSSTKPNSQSNLSALSFENSKPSVLPSDCIPKEREIEYMDAMTGQEFELFCAELLKKCRFINIQITPGTGDQGVDILATKESVKYAIQCKCYATPLGNTPIQEVYAGKSFYGCHVGVVMTNTTFTTGAKELAEKTGVLLWDRHKIVQMSNEFSGLCAIDTKESSFESFYSLNGIPIDIINLKQKHSLGFGNYNKIALIKEVREISGSSLRESKDFVERFLNK